MVPPWEYGGLSTTLSCLVVEADKDEGGETADSQGHLRVHKERIVVGARQLRSAPEIPTGKRGDPILVDFVDGTLERLLYNGKAT